MCTTCGCGDDDHHDHDHHPHAHAHDHAHDHHHDHEPHDREPRTLRVERNLLAKNEGLAAANRRWLTKARVALFNLIGSPGAGKTALLEATIRQLHTHVSMAVLEGDQATDRDAKRIESAGCRVRQINTGVGCHLDASMITDGVQALAPPPSSVLFVENVGNLVCPALFDLGERAKIVVMSVTEGEDKPVKYPHIFRAAELMVLTKMDLLPHVAIDVGRCIAFAREVNPRIEVLRVSATRGDGIDDFCGWIRAEAARAWTQAQSYEASAS